MADLSGFARERPVLDFQAWDLAEVGEVSRQQGRIPGKDNRRDFQVHRTDSEAGASELSTLHTGGLIEIDEGWQLPLA